MPLPPTASSIRLAQNDTDVSLQPSQFNRGRRTESGRRKAVNRALMKMRKNRSRARVSWQLGDGAYPLQIRTYGRGDDNYAFMAVNVGESLTIVSCERVSCHRAGKSCQSRYSGVEGADDVEVVHFETSRN